MIYLLQYPVLMTYSTPAVLFLVGISLLYGLLYYWMVYRPRTHNPYAQGQLPQVIKVNALNDRAYLGVSFVFIVLVYVMILWQVYQDFVYQSKGDLLFLGLVISLLGAIVLLTTLGLVKDYKASFYSIEIRDQSLFLSYKGTLIQTIPLFLISKVLFFSEKKRRRRRMIFPRIAVYTLGDLAFSRIKLSFDSYHLLKTFFLRNNINVIDSY